MPSFMEKNPRQEFIKHIYSKLIGELGQKVASVRQICFTGSLEACPGEYIPPFKPVKIFVSLFAPNCRQLPGSRIFTDWDNAPEHGGFSPIFIHCNQSRRYKWVI